MRSYERNGVTVDQCGECRGIFLDRGELERLVDAELQYNSPSPQPRYEEKRYEEKKRYDDRRYDDDRRYGNQHPRKKKKSFLEELFD
ncbi:zf-TFIIB domain-containing protein [Kribbella sp. CA-245084]|uniref:TFIIB-type zinc ribbon-containing protein n=1 Tax=Kribbella sp. CA-245084 TaxID=3239940 RepID=UPI003D90BAD3